MKRGITLSLNESLSSHPQGTLKNTKVRKAFKAYNGCSANSFVHTQSVDPVEIISDFCSFVKFKNSLNDIFNNFFNYATKLGYSYTAICIPDKEEKNINIKILDNVGNFYCYQLNLNNVDNTIVQCFIDKTRKFTSDSSHLNVFSLNECQSIMIPLVFQNECNGIIIAGSKTRNRDSDEILNILCNYLTLLIGNIKLKSTLSSINREETDQSDSLEFSDNDELEKKLLNHLYNDNNSSKISMEIVTSLAGAIDAKDTYTRGHSQDVSNYAEALAKTINLNKETVEKIKLAALLHDIGKIGISESILRKPGALTDQEWEIMKQHPVIGVKKVLEPVETLRDLIPIVKHHHERIDGYGYPDALKGNEIPLGAKIVAIADAFHALISHRPYRKALSLEKAIGILKAGAGTQWDKDLVRKFISIAPDLV